jgi:hypothetical protein
MDNQQTMPGTSTGIVRDIANASLSDVRRNSSSRADPAAAAAVELESTEFIERVMVRGQNVIHITFYRSEVVRPRKRISLRFQ